MNLTNENSTQDITGVLAQVASDVVGELEMDKLLPKILKTAMDTLQAEVCSIYLRKGDKLECVAGEGFAQDVVGKKYNLGEGLTGTIGLKGEAYNIKSREERDILVKKGIFSGKYDNIQWGQDRKFRNLLALPLKIKNDKLTNEILGVIKVENKTHGDCFTDADEQLFKIIANVITLAIGNAKSHEKAERQSRIISNALADIAAGSVGAVHRNELLHTYFI